MGEIIGREGELSVVQAFLDRRADGLRALVLEGEPGIGKSTLWLASVAAARERHFRVLTSRPAETERTLSNLVLGDLFGDVTSEVLAELPPPRRHAFESALLLRDEPGPPVDPRALGVAIVTLLPSLAGGRPLLLAIDDDQWIDPSSAATLGFAMRRLVHQPLLLLLSRRAGGTRATTALEEATNTVEVERLGVGPLSLGAIQLLVRHRLDITFPRPTLLRIHEVSGGNPFYALELARAQVQDPVRDVTMPLVVPPSLERLTGARLDVLDAPTRWALLLVAAHGRLPVGFLRALEVVPGALDQATAASVIETSEGVVRFTHPLLASALYQSMGGGERRAAHRRLAMALDDPVHRGRHLALGADEPDGELATELDAAVSVARNRGMPIAAAELAEHARRLTPADAPDDRDRRAIVAAWAYLDAGEGSRARSIFDDLQARTPKGPRRAEALLLSRDLNDPGSAVILLDQALREAAGVPALEAVIHAALADMGRSTNGRAWAERHARASLGLAERLDDDALRATALSILALVRFQGGDPHALGLAERAYRLARQLADPREIYNAGEAVGQILTWSGMYERAREWMVRQLDDWGDRDEQVRDFLAWHLALVEVWCGRWSIASEYADESREISVAYGLEGPLDLLPAALIALHRGQFALVRDCSRRALSFADGPLPPPTIAVIAVCEWWSGNPATALADFVRAERAADEIGWDHPNMRWWRPEHIEALLRVGRIEDATRLVADWEAAAVRIGRERVLAHAMRCRGLIAAARGNLPAALDLLEQAADRHESVGDPFGRCRALLALGVVRRRARQKRTARVALEASVTGFEALGADSWSATARAELSRIGGRTRIEGLSPSELRVAELVAAGRTNREIASALFLAERTVASHLTRIYSKVGVRSRTELARQRIPLASPSPGASKDQTS